MPLCGTGNGKGSFLSKKMLWGFCWAREEPAVGFGCRLRFAVRGRQSSGMPARGGAIAAQKEMVRRECEVRWDLFCQLCVTKGLRMDSPLSLEVFV